MTDQQEAEAQQARALAEKVLVLALGVESPPVAIVSLIGVAVTLAVKHGVPAAVLVDLVLTGQGAVEDEMKRGANE